MNADPSTINMSNEHIIIDQAMGRALRKSVKVKVEPELKFNYCVGHLWGKESGSIGVYAYGSEVHYGTLLNAKKFLQYVDSMSPEKNWKIFQLVEVPLK